MFACFTCINELKSEVDFCYFFAIGWIFRAWNILCFLTLEITLPQYPLVAGVKMSASNMLPQWNVMPTLLWSHIILLYTNGQPESPPLCFSLMLDTCYKATDLAKPRKSCVHFAWRYKICWILVQEVVSLIFDSMLSLKEILVCYK